VSTAQSVVITERKPDGTKSASEQKPLKTKIRQNENVKTYIDDSGVMLLQDLSQCALV